MKNLLLFSAVAVLATAGATALVKKAFFSRKKHKEAAKFVATADEVDVTLIDEKSGSVVSTTSDEDVILPLEDLPDNYRKKTKTPEPMSPEKMEKIKAMMKGGHTVMVVAKKFRIPRRKAYAIFTRIKREKEELIAA